MILQAWEGIRKSLLKIATFPLNSYCVLLMNNHIFFKEGNILILFPLIQIYFAIFKGKKNETIQNTKI